VVAVALSWAVSHAEGRVTPSIRSAFTAAVYEFATHSRVSYARLPFWRITGEVW
jgi:hypothetical protein